MAVTFDGSLAEARLGARTSSRRPTPRVVVACCIALLAFNAAAQKLELITEEEARLPSAAKSIPTRSISRGPEIQLVSPVSGESSTSPIRLRLVFQPRGGVKIDTDSIQLRYLKLNPILLTSRVKDYIKPNGILIEEAYVPPGTHEIEVVVRDTDERETSLTVRLIVKKPN